MCIVCQMVFAMRCLDMKLDTEMVLPDVDCRALCDVLPALCQRT